MSYELYRQTKIGESLVEALDELVSEEKIPPDMAMKVLEQFDKVCIFFVRLLLSFFLSSPATSTRSILSHDVVLLSIRSYETLLTRALERGRLHELHGSSPCSKLFPFASKAKRW